MPYVPYNSKGRKSFPWSAAKSPAAAKRYFGGRFPDIKGRKYRYPKQTDTEGWMRLLRQAVAYDQRNRRAVAAGRSPGRPNRKFDYVLFHARPQEKKRRSIRGQHRAAAGLRVGDGLQVHHLDPHTMDGRKTVVLDHCSHARAHRRKCKTPTKRVRMKPAKKKALPPARTP